LAIRVEQNSKDSDNSHSQGGSDLTATAFVYEKKIRAQIKRQLDGLGFTSIKTPCQLWIGGCGTPRT
jgi:hypothetical protein